MLERCCALGNYGNHAVVLNCQHCMLCCKVESDEYCKATGDMLDVVKPVNPCRNSRPSEDACLHEHHQHSTVPLMTAVWCILQAYTYKQDSGGAPSKGDSPQQHSSSQRKARTLFHTLEWLARCAEPDVLCCKLNAFHPSVW